MMGKQDARNRNGAAGSRGRGTALYDRTLPKALLLMKTQGFDACTGICCLQEHRAALFLLRAQGFEAAASQVLQCECTWGLGAAACARPERAPAFHHAQVCWYTQEHSRCSSRTIGTPAHACICKRPPRPLSHPPSANAPLIPSAIPPQPSPSSPAISFIPSAIPPYPPTLPGTHLSLMSSRNCRRWSVLHHKGCRCTACMAGRLGGPLCSIAYTCMHTHTHMKHRSRRWGGGGAGAGARATCSCEALCTPASTQHRCSSRRGGQGPGARPGCLAMGLAVKSCCAASASVCTPLASSLPGTPRTQELPAEWLASGGGAVLRHPLHFHRHHHSPRRNTGMGGNGQENVGRGARSAPRVLKGAQALPSCS